MNNLFENSGQTLPLYGPAEVITAHSAVVGLQDSVNRDLSSVQRSLRGIMDEIIETKETVVLGGTMAEVAIEGLRQVTEQPERNHPWRVDQAKMMLGIDVDNPEPSLQTVQLKDVTVIEQADQTIDSIPVFTESDL